MFADILVIYGLVIAILLDGFWLNVVFHLALLVELLLDGFGYLIVVFPIVKCNVGVEFADEAVDFVALANGEKLLDFVGVDFDLAVVNVFDDGLEVIGLHASQVQHRIVVVHILEELSQHWAEGG